jgi:PAS domain S-box-containing protein
LFQSREWLRKILAAIVPPLIVALIQWHFRPTMARWAMFYPAVFLSAWFGGAFSGVIATIGSGLIVWWAFMPPWESWTGKDPANVVAAVIFAFMSLGVSALQQRLRSLATERSLLAALIENSTDFIGIADPSRKPVYLNPAGRAMVGLTDDAPMSEVSIIEFYAPSARDTALGEIEPSTIGRGLWQGETRFRHWRTGAEIPVWQHNFLVRDPKSGRLLGIGTITRDISEMKRNRDALQAANRQLAESQRLLQAVMDFSPIVIVVKDRDGRYALVNRMLASMLGMSVDAVRGKSDVDLFPREIAERHRSVDAAVVEKRTATTYEEVFEKDGVRRVFLINKVPLQDADNNVFGVCSIWSEITDRKRAEEALRQRESDLREAERLGHMGSWTWDARTDSARFSDELYRIFGRDPSEPLPALFRDDDEEPRWFTRESVDCLRKAIKKALNDGQPFETELDVKRPDGSIRHVMTHADAIRDQSGKVVSIAGAAQDITELREAQRMRDEWTSVIAHDLRQPIGVILMAASALPTLRAEGLHDKEALFLSRISSAGNALARMVDDLLDLSLLEARRLQLQRKWTNARAFVTDTVARLAHVTGERRVRIVTSDGMSDGARDVFIDPMRVGQVLGNLISNAVKYGEPGTEIEVRIEQRAAEVEIAVTNHGRGIAPEDLPHLFARFMRSKEARGSETPGLGVGLYIARELIEAHEGRIWAESTPGKITTFHLTLPSRVAPRRVA